MATLIQKLQFRLPGSDIWVPTLPSCDLGHTVRSLRNAVASDTAMLGAGMTEQEGRDRVC